jgi:hypothetical protein
VSSAKRGIEAQLDVPEIECAECGDIVSLDSTPSGIYCWSCDEWLSEDQ